jgi:hypothetical protein
MYDMKYLGGDVLNESGCARQSHNKFLTCLRLGIGTVDNI